MHPFKIINRYLGIDDRIMFTIFDVTFDGVWVISGTDVYIKDFIGRMNVLKDEQVASTGSSWILRTEKLVDPRKKIYGCKVYTSNDARSLIRSVLNELFVYFYIMRMIRKVRKAHPD